MQGVSQGSVLAPHLFCLYMLTLGQMCGAIMTRLRTHSSIYQCRRIKASSLKVLCHCLEQSNKWMKQSFLQLKTIKNRIVLGNKEKRLAIRITWSYCH